MAEAPVKSPPSASFKEGSRFGNYIVGPCIGRGGMARIYRAEHEGLRRQVALKVLTEGVAKDADGHARFVREARIAAAIKHPNVVNIFDVGVQNEIPYLVMELLEGQDLEALLRQRGILDEATIIALLVPVVAGLAAVHDAGVVHRDLKPGNVFLARGRNDEVEPKVLDFGISKALEGAELQLTLANATLLGTPIYISPEAVQGQEVTPLSDQYSLGVLMYECATGENPFEAESIAEVLRLITEGRYASPVERNPALSPHLAYIIERAMHRDPGQRFGNLRQMGRELLQLADPRMRITWALSFGVEIETAAAGTRATAAIATSLTPQGEPPLPWFRRRPWLALGAALLLVGSCATVVAAVSANTRQRNVAQLSPAKPLQAPAAPPLPVPAPRSVPDPAPPSTPDKVSVSPAPRPEPAPAPRYYYYRPPPPVSRPTTADDLPEPAAEPSATGPALGTNGAPILD